MYEELLNALRKRAHDLPERFSKNALNIELFLKAADAIEAQDRRILTLQREMMAEAESHIAEVNRLNKQIEELQADVRPVVRGKWRLYSPLTDTYECDKCGYQVIDESFRTNFCPNCGADMREPPKEEQFGKTEQLIEPPKEENK